MISTYSSYKSKFFSDNELRCKETGELDMHPEFLRMIDRLRRAYFNKFKEGLIVSSGFRSVKHSVEIKKKELVSILGGLLSTFRLEGSELYT